MRKLSFKNIDADSINDLRYEQDAFLLPNDEHHASTEEAVLWVEKRWQVFFEYFLREWIVDESLWPTRRTLRMFRQWFSIQCFPTVYDLCPGPISYEDWKGELVALPPLLH